MQLLAALLPTGSNAPLLRSPLPRGRPMPDTPTMVVGVHLVLVKDGRVLLGRRRNTAFAEDHWHVPAGHLLEGESITRGMVREADEELGITIREEDLDLVHAVHHLDADDGKGRLQLFFKPRAYVGQITNREPEKCHELKYWPIRELPAPVVDYTTHALGRITAGSLVSVYGWSA
ncbi:NUDIX domain-containing protein [Kitasatospora sp. NPDC004669]|uniref:NUDIX hydrolase n=1 Tax=Kitasatospora sp. NPDC004669 TaxID=3154555 RepID=UPI0033A40CCB